MYEWTIYATIVAVRQDKLWVVSYVASSKCTSLSSSSHQNNHHNKIGWILHDGHAEILARREFHLVLWQHLQSKTSTIDMNADIDNIPLLLEKEKRDDERETTWRRNTDITSHLYISDSLCGDASFFHTKMKKTKILESTLHF